MKTAALARWQHARAIGKTWWWLLPAIWSLFWTADGCIAKWGSPALKLWWDGHTTHLPKRWEAWLVVLLFLMLVSLFEKSFRHHREGEEAQRREIATLTTEVERLRAESRADKPNFKVTVAWFIVAPSGESDAIVFALGTIENLGGAGAVAEFRMELEIGGRTIQAEFANPPNADEKILIGKSADGNDMSLLGASYWGRTARQSPIPKFSPCDGWLMAKFRGVTKKEIIAKKGTVIVICSDVFGNTFRGEKTISGKETLPFSIGSMQEKKEPQETSGQKPLAEQIARRLRGLG